MRKERKTTDNKERVVAHLILAIVALALLYPLLLHPTWWIWSPGAEYSDLAVTHWPNAHFTRRMLWEQGQFPLWRPTIMSGAPFAANPLAGLYYPLNWLFLFLPWLPLSVGFNLSALVHLWLAGGMMYALMRRGLGAGTWGALTAAVAYQASPKLLAHLGAGHVGWTQAWAWLPLVILCVMQAGGGAEERGSKWAVGAGVVLAVQFCADVRMAAYTLIAALTLALFLAIRTFAIRSFTRSLFAIRPFAIFLGLTACQWLPLLALLPETTRGAMTLSDATVWSLPPRYLLGLLVADRGGFHEWMTYVGLSTLLLAALGAWLARRVRRRRWLVGWLVGLAVFAAWFSLGKNGGLFTLLYRLVPGLGLLRVPPRIWVLVTFAAAALAGLGVDETIRRGSRNKQNRAGPLLFGLVAAGLVAADLVSVDVTLIEARAPEQVFAAGRAAAAWLAAQPGHFRVYSPSYSIPQHVAELYELELADGVDPLQLRSYADYLTRAAGLEPQGYSVTLPPFPEGSDDVHMALQDVSPDAEMLGRLSVRYVAAAFPISAPELLERGVMDGVHIYSNQAAQPVVEAGRAIELDDGTVLFEYNPWPVYAGWAVSIATLIGLSVAWLWKQRTDD